jgi:DegV family protein with EDD domain
MKIKLIADSTCDLPMDLIQKHNIRVAHLGISMGGKILRDGVDVTPRKIFDYMDSDKGLCSPVSVDISEYRAIYTEELLHHDAILHFVGSSELSECFNNACHATAEFSNICVVDTRNFSTAIGHLVLDAAEMIAKGMKIDGIYREIMMHRRNLVDASFVVDTISYLHKSELCTALEAFSSNMLRIKPGITMVDGKLEEGKNYYGEMESVLRRYVKDRLRDKESIDTRRLFITHTMTEQNQAMVNMVKALVAVNLPFTEVYEAKAGSIISCHFGSNALGLTFFRKA